MTAGFFFKYFLEYRALISLMQLTSINGYFSKAIIRYFRCTAFVTVESTIFLKKRCIICTNCLVIMWQFQIQRTLLKLAMRQWFLIQTTYVNSSKPRSDPMGKNREWVPDISSSSWNYFPASSSMQFNQVAAPQYRII